MTYKEAIKLLTNATYSEEWQGNEDLTEAQHMAIEALKKESPCDLCRYNPPSSCDEKPCYYCPACGQKIDWSDYE